MDEHPVRRKLRHDILPWLESAKLLKKQWFYRAHIFFGYATDITVALGSVGISVPLLTLLTEPAHDGQSAASRSLASVLPEGPKWLYVVAAIAAVIWVIFRVAFNKEEGQKRAVLAKSCAQALKQSEAKLYRILAQPDPMPDLVRMANEEIGAVIDRNIQEGAYPWAGPAPGIDKQIEAQLTALTEKFSNDWAPVINPSGRQG